MALLLCLSCNRTSSNSSDFDVDLIQNPNTAQGYDNNVGMPQLVFDTDLHDFGRISEGESISYSFHFTNKGKPTSSSLAAMPVAAAPWPTIPRSALRQGPTAMSPSLSTLAARWGNSIRRSPSLPMPSLRATYLKSPLK